MSNDHNVSAVVATKGRQPGPGAIELTEAQKPEFVRLWNKAASLTKEQLGEKKRMDVLKAGLLKNKLCNDETQVSQIRACAAKLRKEDVKDNEGKEVAMRERHTVDPRKVLAAWTLMSTPKAAFEKLIAVGVFTIEGETEDDKKESRKENLLRFRSAVSQLQKAIPTMKKMGAKRLPKIEAGLFIKIWNESKSVSEVLKKLVKLNACGSDTKKSSIKSRANSLNAAAEKEGKPAPCKKFERNSDKMASLMALLNGDAADMARLLDEDAPDSDVDEDEDEDEDEDDGENAVDEDDEDAEVTDEDDEESKPEVKDDEFF
jgi:hypothetical protein